jgi:ElaB/YqjD/DUF883 family membrane-anchored ribosome-binding protein
MNDSTTTRDPAEIERDIRRTQDEMSQTVDRIGDQLTPRNLVNALLDKAEANNVDARALIDGARRNPIALAMIAGGAIWLVSESDAKLPSIGRSNSSSTKPVGDQHHRDYVAHMERVEWRDGEDPQAYQRRRDLARANFLMCERRHDEDETSFRQRLDDLTEKFREKRQAWTDQGGRAFSSAGQSAGATLRSAARGAQDLFSGNPLIGGLAAAAVGAILGTVIPITETEEQQLGGIGEKARDFAAQHKEELTEAAREKKEELLNKVEDSADRPEASGTPSSIHANDASEQPLQQAASQGQLLQSGSDQQSSGQQSGAMIGGTPV